MSSAEDSSCGEWLAAPFGKAGALAGLHLATIVEGKETLRKLGRKLLWDGVQEIVFNAR